MPPTIIDLEADDFMQMESYPEPALNNAADEVKATLSPRPHNGRKRKASAGLPVNAAPLPKKKRARAKLAASLRDSIMAPIPRMTEAQKGRRASKFEVQMTANPKLPLDEGVVEHLGDNCRVMVDNRNVPMHATLYLPSNETEGEQFLQMQFLDIGNASPRYQIWCRKGYVGVSAGSFTLLGDGTLGEAWGEWYKSFTEHTGLLWIYRDHEPMPGYWTFKPIAWDPALTSIGQGGTGKRWQPVSQLSPKPIDPTVDQSQVINGARETQNDSEIETRAAIPEGKPVAIKTEASLELIPTPSLSAMDIEGARPDTIVELDQGVFDRFGYGCKVVQTRNGTIFNAALALKDTNKGIDRFCCLQAIKNGNGEFYAWIREGNVGTPGTVNVLRNGEQWGIYKWFKSTFKRLTGLGWSGRLRRSLMPGRYRFLLHGWEDHKLHTQSSKSEAHEEDKVKAEADSTQYQAPKQAMLNAKSASDLVIDLEDSEEDEMEAQLP